MFKRLLTHFRNTHESIIWILGNIYSLKKDLNLRGYSSVKVFKFILWNSQKKYFKVKNEFGTEYFVKINTNRYVIHESSIISKIESLDTDKLNFYPKFILKVNGRFDYNIFEFINGEKISKKNVVGDDITKQILDILKFFKKNEISHKDIRPHNIIMHNNKIKVIDYEHCSIKNIKINFNKPDLNKLYSPPDGTWDDAFSFFEILKKILEKEEIEKDFFCTEIFNMIKYEKK